MTASARLTAAVDRGFDRATTTTFGVYQTAVVRIGTAAVFLLLLLREWPNRYELYGPRGPMYLDLAAFRAESREAFSVLLWSDGTMWFELAYHFAIAASLMLLVGWRTRAASVLFMIAVISVHHRNPFISNGGENVLHLMSIYLVATRCGRVWSLDARRARAPGRPDRSGPVLWAVLGVALAAAGSAGVLTWGWAMIFTAMWLIHGAWWAACRYAPGEPRTVGDMLATLVHNTGLLAIILQICVLYASAGWYKIAGERWLDGTAAYFPLRLDLFTPWPVLSDLVTSYSVPVIAMTYATVIIQVAFPFTLFHRTIKNVLLAMLIAEHAAIGVLLGLPIFSLAVIAADLIFLPTRFLRRVERMVMRPLRRKREARPAAAEAQKEPAAA